MIYLWLILLLIVNAFCLATVLFALPGNWLMITATILFALWQKGTFSIYTIIAAIVLAFAGELFEFLAGAGGARAAGGSKKSMAAAIIGAILGAIIGTIFIPVPVFGTLIGSALGAAAAVLAVEKSSGRQFRHSLHTAAGAGIGQIFGIGGKFFAGLVIWLIFAFAAFL